MVLLNGEVETPGTRRDKETSQCGIDTKQRRRFGQASSEVGNKPLSANRDDWSWRNFIKSCGQANIGGILNRLILNTERQINESEQRTAEKITQIKNRTT